MFNHAPVFFSPVVTILFQIDRIFAFKLSCIARLETRSMSDLALEKLRYLQVKSSGGQAERM